MSTVSILKTELAKPEYATLTDQERMDLLAIKNIPVKQPISIRDIEAYLTLRNLFFDISESTLRSAKRAIFLLDKFLPAFDVTMPAVESSLTQALDNLITDGLIDETTYGDKSTILGMGTVMMSKASAPVDYGGLGLSGLTLQHYKDARS